MKKLFMFLGILGLTLTSQAVTNNVTWAPRPIDEEITFYSVYEWSNGGTGPAVKIGTTDGTVSSFGLNRAAGYHVYSMTASNVLGEGPHSLQGSTEPDTLTAFTAARLVNRDVRFNWTTNVAAQKVLRHFVYEWITNSPVLVGSSVSNSLVITGIAAGQHEYTIVASNSFGNSLHSLSILLKGPSGPPGAPGSFQIVPAGSGLQAFIISPPRGGVVVQRAVPGSNKYKTWTTVAAPANDTPTEIKLVARNLPAYDYRIKARN